MSRDLVVYVKTSNTFEEILQNLEKLLGVTFISQYHQPWLTAYFSGLGLTLRVVGDLDYEDDMGIPFSQYDYQIFVFAYLTVKERKIWFNLEYYMAMFIYMRIDEKLGWKCMLVEDAQRLLAKN